MKKRFFQIGLLCLTAICGISLWACGGSVSIQFTDKEHVEKAHGLKLPDSSHTFQQGTWGTLLDKGIISIFEMEASDLDKFLSALSISKRQNPLKDDADDPCKHTPGIWPTKRDTFIPIELSGCQNTWGDEAIPIEMLSCDSTTGDWLHAEIWGVTQKHLIIRLYTDWN